MSRRKPKKFDVIGTGWVQSNMERWMNARLILFRPGWGIVSVGFDNAKPSILVLACKGDKIADIGADMAEGESYHGIGFWSDGLRELSYDREKYPSGDIRDMVEPALRHLGWPVDPKRYFLIGKYGHFWDRPAPVY